MAGLPLTTRRSYVPSSFATAAFLEPLPENHSPEGHALRVDGWEEEMTLGDEVLVVRRIHIEARDDDIDILPIFEEPVPGKKHFRWCLSYSTAAEIRESGHTLSEHFAKIMAEYREEWKEKAIHAVYVTFNRRSADKPLLHAFGVFPHPFGVDDLRLPVPVALTPADQWDGVPARSHIRV